MTPENRNAFLAAGAFLVVFGLAAFYLPAIMIYLGDRSMIAAGAVAALFMFAFFIVLWLRSRAQHRKD